MTRRSLILSFIVLFQTVNMTGQPAFLTVAESSDFKSTSNYDDVMSFIEKLKEILKIYQGGDN